MQWSADVSERLLITHCKHTFRRGSNHRDFVEQCVRVLDRLEKVRMFDFYSLLRNNHQSFGNSSTPDLLRKAHPQSAWIFNILPNERLVGVPRTIRSFFSHSALTSGAVAAFHLNVSPDIPRISIADAAMKFGILDLHGALGDYQRRFTYQQRGGKRLSDNDVDLPFEHLRIWFKFKIQLRPAHDKGNILPARTIQALPPSSQMPQGHCDTVLMKALDKDSPSGIHSQRLVVYCLLIRTRLTSWTGAHHPPAYRIGEADTPTLLYVQLFKFSGSRDDNGILAEAPNVDMYVLQRHMRTARRDGEKIRMGDIVPMTDITQPVELIPIHGASIDPHITSHNSLEIPSHFYLNNFDDKETYTSLLSEFL